MKIPSLRFGDLDVAEDRLITFPLGLPGFESCRRFAMVHPEQEAPRVFFLQSADQPEVAFSIAGPDQFGIHYQFALDDAEHALVGGGTPEDLAVMVILRRADAADGGDAPVRAILNAPLVINLNTRLGFQKAMTQLGCDITLSPRA